jgi:outer membrane protein TolC
MRNIFKIFSFLLLSANVQAQASFSSLDSLLSYADKKSGLSKISDQQLLLAKWTKVAALANSVNFRNPVSFSATNNLLLPVNFIPAEAFGGPAGTFRQITLGQQYVSNFNFNPQIDLINPGNIAKAKSASINQELTALSVSISKKNQHEGIATSYYNYHGMKKQAVVMKKSLEQADTLVFILKNKFESGIIREQDLNNAKANQLNIQDKLSQLKTNLEIQANALMILCDIPSELRLNEPSNLSLWEVRPSSSLQQKYQVAQSRYAKSELNAMRFSMLPVVSAVYYQGWQKNSNTGFTDGGANWIESKYIGLRVTLPFPPDATKLSQTYANKVSYKIASLNADHLKIQEDLSNKNLGLEYERSLATYETALKIIDLKRMNYEKSLAQFKEGLLSADLLINYFNDLLSSELNVSVAWSALELSKSRIIINNSIK